MRIAHIVPAALLAATVLTASTAAEAHGGCGPGFHRGFYGYCRPNPFVRPFAYRPGFYGYRRVGWYGGWRRPWGWRRVGWGGGWRGGWHGGWGHRPWGWRRW